MYLTKLSSIYETPKPDANGKYNTYFTLKHYCYTCRQDVPVVSMIADCHGDEETLCKNCWKKKLDEILEYFDAPLNLSETQILVNNRDEISKG